MGRRYGNDDDDGEDEDLVFLDPQIQMSEAIGMSRKLICIIGLMAIALCMATVSAQDNSLQVTGVSTIQVPTDTVIIAITAQNNNDNISLAEEANSNMLNKTKNALLAAGVKKEEILPDRYKGHLISHKMLCDTMNNTTSCTNVVLNVATEQMIIKMKTNDANQTQKVIDAAESSGTRAAIQGYGLSDPSNAVDKARQKALENAKAKAEYYATRYGLTLGESMQVEEPTYPDIDIDIGPSYRWDSPMRMSHIFREHPFMRMDRFWVDSYIPEGMAEVTAYVSVIYKVQPEDTI
jgi:uncharacterized protein